MELNRNTEHRTRSNVTNQEHRIRRTNGAKQKQRTRINNEVKQDNRTTRK